MRRFSSILAKWSKSHYNSLNKFITVFMAMAKKIEKKPHRSQHGQRLSALWLCFLMFVFGYLAASWFDVNQFGNWVGSQFKSHPATEPASVKKSMVEKPTVEQHPKLEFYTLLSSDSGLHINPNASTETATVNMQYKSVPDKLHNAPSHVAASASAPMELAITAPASEPVPASVQTPKPARVVSTPKPAPKSVPKPGFTPAFEPTRMENTKGRYVIQVGSFRILEDAKRLREKLAARGFSTNITPVSQQSTYWYRVMVGPFSSLMQAQQAQSSIANREHITGMIRKTGG